MPDRDYTSLTPNQLNEVKDYKPGYDWIPGRFGPPPGIPKQKKEQLDRMSDRDYMAVVMRMGQEEKESLMISEAERLRTYQSLWPNPPFLNTRQLAREGFYYTGVSDRVQCAFCAGFLGNWEKGDVPRDSHKKFFSYCKMAQRKACANIPMSTSECGSSLSEELSNTELLNMRADNFDHEFTMRDLGINSSVAKHPRYKVPSTRLGSYKRYSTSHPMTAEELSEAGFFYEGPGDKVRCFWCDGALELWSRGDNAWKEHAKWYPGCSYIQQVKDKDFIKASRSEMSADELSTAELLEYNNSGTDFLLHTTGLKTEPKEVEGMELGKVDSVTQYDTYQTCLGIGFSKEHLHTAFKQNRYNDFSTVQVLISALYAIRDGDSSRLDAVLEEEKTEQGNFGDDEDRGYEDSGDDRSLVDVAEFVKDPAEFGEDFAMKVSVAMNCRICRKEKLGAVVLPCGDFVLCQSCSTGNLPSRCPTCQTPVRGSCRVFLG